MASKEVSAAVDANMRGGTAKDQENEPEGEQRKQDLSQSDSIAQERLTINLEEVSTLRFIYWSNDCKMAI